MRKALLAGLVVLAGLSIGVLGHGAHYATAATTTQGSKQLAPAYPNVPCGSFCFTVFDTNSTTLNYAGGQVLLTNGSGGPVLVDDAVNITVTNANGTQSLYYDFSHGCGPLAPTPLDLTSLFAPGQNTVTVQRSDVCGGNISSTPLVLTYNLVAPTTKDDCKDGGWTTFNNPAFKNQGDCVSFIATGGRNPGNG